MPKKPSTRSPERQRGPIALILDIGTTGVKALAFDRSFDVVAKAYVPLAKRSPASGRVEQDPAELIGSSVHVLRAALREAGVAAAGVVGVGITNQRETTVVWDDRTGRHAAPAIVWEDRRTARTCALIRRARGGSVRRITGLEVDTYFSATKLSWLLANSSATARLRRQGRLAFGTVDSWALRRLCAGGPHLTDVTNASRTLLFDIAAERWDPGLLRTFGIPPEVLPEVRPSISRYGMLDGRILGAPVPVTAVCGDQQASMYAAVREAEAAGIPGPVTKVTFGTGVFVMQEARNARVRVPGFFTTLVPDGSGRAAAALEQKIGDCAKEVTRRLGDERALRRYFDRLAGRIGGIIDRLPARPRAIIVDGGAARDGIAAAALERATGIPARMQRTYDGTALGMAKMVLGR